MLTEDSPGLHGVRDKSGLEGGPEIAIGEAWDALVLSPVSTLSKAGLDAGRPKPSHGHALRNTDAYPEVFP